MCHVACIWERCRCTLKFRQVISLPQSVAGSLYFVRLTSKLDAMSPLKVLSRGYSMTFDAQGHVVRSVRTLSCGDRITVRLADGRASAEVREIQEDAT